MRAWPIRDGPPVGKPVAIRIEHPEYTEAQRIGERIQDRLRAMPGVHDISDNLDIGPQELRLTFREQQAAELGVTYAQVGQALRGANDGLEVGIYKDTENDEDVDIKVRINPDDLVTLDDLRDIEVSGAGGLSIKLRQVADLHFEQTYVSRYHYDGKRAVQITADVDTEAGTDANVVNRAILEEFKPLENEDPGLTIHAGGQFEETQESFSGLWRSALIAVALMYLILASQFRSYLQPLVVLMAVGFGMIGMVLGLVTYRYPFTVVTGIAMVGLSGVVVNDALVLLDFINKERARGAPLLEALHAGCRRRVRPILLTTLTTVFGLAPMALGVGGYSKIWSPFAMSMCWGLLMATGLTLVLVPAFYHITDDLARTFRRKPESPAPAIEPLEQLTP
jgi:HAE1 family hydrophobic/amphiphilic exporter-1